MKVNLSTEEICEFSADLDLLSPIEILHVMNRANADLSQLIAKCLPQVEKAVKSISTNMRLGGRLIYIGAGTSGKLGALDAAECTPTFSVAEGTVIAVVAGQNAPSSKEAEAAEDDVNEIVFELQKLKLKRVDSIVGISASGRTPFVYAGLNYAGSIGCTTISVACNTKTEISSIADVAIEVDTGAEILIGSTRLKAGSAQKMILNMISTTCMVLQGKTYKNLMVDLQVTNVKLQKRAERIVSIATGSTLEEAVDGLKKSQYDIKLAILMILLNCSLREAKSILLRSRGSIRSAIEDNNVQK